VDPATRIHARPDNRERWGKMHGMTDILGQIGVLAALLLQRSHDPLDELWEPEFILLIVFLGGLVAAVVWLGVRIFPKVRRDERLEAPRDSAEEILRERFARGEITAEEYQRSIKILRGENAREVPDDTQEAG
jgi:hypothetical protein